MHLLQKSDHSEKCATTNLCTSIKTCQMSHGDKWVLFYYKFILPMRHFYETVCSHGLQLTKTGDFCLLVYLFK